MWNTVYLFFLKAGIGFSGNRYAKRPGRRDEDFEDALRALQNTDFYDLKNSLCFLLRLFIEVVSPSMSGSLNVSAQPGIEERF